MNDKEFLESLKRVVASRANSAKIAKNAERVNAFCEVFSLIDYRQKQEETK